MSYEWYDVIGSAGVIIILLAYFLLQTHRLTSICYLYSLLNAAGAALVLASLVGAFNFAAFILELVWLLMSIWGLISVYRHQHRVDEE